MIKRKIFNEIILLIILTFFFLICPLGADPVILWSCLGVFYYYFFRSIKNSVTIVGGIKTFFKIDILFLLFYYLLLYYPYQTYVLGSRSIETNAWMSNTFVEYSNKAIIASTIGLVSFMMGFGKKIAVKFKLNRQLEFSKNQEELFFTSLMLLNIVLFVLFFLQGGAVMLSGAYQGSRTKDSEIDGVYTLLSVFISMLGGVSVFYYRKYKAFNFKVILSLLVFAAFCYITLVGGDRNTFFIVAIALVGGYYTYVKSISRKMLLGFAVLALALYQVVEISRMSEERSIEAIVSVVTGTADIKATSNLSGNVDEGSFSITNLVTRASFHFVPDRHDLFLGKFKVIGFAGFIPYARSLIIDPNDPDASSSRYISRMNNSGFGLGSSIVMDSYMEFGLIGIFVFLYLLGWLGNYIQTKAQQQPQSMKWAVIYLLTLGTYAEIPRYTFDFIVKNLGWALLLFVVFEIFVKPKTKVMLKDNL